MYDEYSDSTELQFLRPEVEDLVEATRRGELGENSIIAAMLKDADPDGKRVRYGALYGHVVNLMIAGHETTAATLAFTLQLLAEHPSYEERALEELGLRLFLGRGLFSA